MATTSGYARTVRIWRRGTQADQAQVIFEVVADHVEAGCNVERTVVPPRLWFVDQVDAFNSATHRDWLAIRPREP